MQTKHLQVGDSGQIAVPTIVHEALSSPGQPLDESTRAFLEPRFGHDFSRVRVHTGQVAVRSAEAVAAQAYTVGADVVFGAGRYAPESRDGQRLLAHELAHVVQQRGTDATPSLQRFAASEIPKIAPTFIDMLATIQSIITASSSSSILGDELNMEQLVENSGGSSASREMGKKLKSQPPHVKSMLLPRYLFTCRCGLLDMRHFLQLFYISNFVAGFEGESQSQANRYATRKGREHELTSEPESRFGAEDTPSNALGAFTNIGLAANPKPGAVFDAIKETLTRCKPIDFKSLSAASQGAIAHYYGDLIPDPTPKKVGDQIPKNQNQTAVPDILNIKECGGRERSFPFSLDTGDAERKTLSGIAFEKGSTELKKGSDIRDFIATQRLEIIGALPGAEKIRLVKVLLSGTVRDEDTAAVEVIYKNSSAAEQAQINSVKDLLSGMYGGQSIGGSFGGQ